MKLKDVYIRHTGEVVPKSDGPRKKEGFGYDAYDPINEFDCSNFYALFLHLLMHLMENGPHKVHNELMKIDEYHELVRVMEHNRYYTDFPINLTRYVTEAEEIAEARAA
jgi:hypothetical protein